MDEEAVADEEAVLDDETVVDEKVVSEGGERTNQPPRARKWNTWKRRASSFLSAVDPRKVVGGAIGAGIDMVDFITGDRTDDTFSNHSRTSSFNEPYSLPRHVRAHSSGCACDGYNRGRPSCTQHKSHTSQHYATQPIPPFRPPSAGSVPSTPQRGAPTQPYGAPRARSSTPSVHYQSQVYHNGYVYSRRSEA